MRNEKETVTILPFPFMVVGTLFAFCLGVGIGLFTLLYEPCRNQLNILHWCIIGFACGICPILLILVSSRRGLSVIKMDENGIRRLVFGFIKSIEMKWDDIAEIRYFERFMPFLILSKTITLEGKPYDKVVKRKDVIQIQLSKKVYDTIIKYIKQPIIGLTEETLTTLKFK